MADAAPRLGCSTISFRAKGLEDALETIAELGFREVDLGALPGVCDHVPLPLSNTELSEVVAAVQRSGLHVRSINADTGPLNAPDLDDATHTTAVEQLSRLAAAVEADFLVMPCGAHAAEPARSLEQDLALVAERLHATADRAAVSGTRLLVEAPHHYRLCNTVERSAALFALLDPAMVGAVLDVSHVAASGHDVASWARRSARRTEHVHLRDARPGNINLSIGNGVIDFAEVLEALSAEDYEGHFALELETHDIEDSEREHSTARARDVIGRLLTDLPEPTSPTRSEP